MNPGVIRRDDVRDGPRIDTISRMVESCSAAGSLPPTSAAMPMFQAAKRRRMPAAAAKRPLHDLPLSGRPNRCEELQPVARSADDSHESAFDFHGSPARGRQKSRRRGEDTPKAPRAFADPLRLPALASGDDAAQNLDAL